VSFIIYGANGVRFLRTPTQANLIGR